MMGEFVKKHVRLVSFTAFIVGALLVAVILSIGGGPGPFSKWFSNTNTSKEKVFTKAGITMTLTENFQEKEIQAQTAVYVSPESMITVLKEENTAFQAAGLSADMTLKEYAKLVISNNKMNATVFEKDGLTCFQFEKQINGKDNIYFASVYKGSDAYWLVQFACEKKNYQSNEAQFVKWAKLVKVS